ncbi:carboxymuconolactone decarboxylase family protein [Paenibacillus aestuarii]|uniref:Carboxymuconolactone decarboxylase family protein n=1 Tax=Paenibacillus aestuarii TaxID=516965 RepID=A0ABW0K9W0_9BACL|nr:hypothetical protein [Paenibacillus aestuarii]
MVPSSAESKTNEVNEVFKARKIALPLESQTQTEENTQFDKGLAVQVEIFGDHTTMRENAPKNQKHIQDYLSYFCFGDFCTRGGLGLQTRELLTLCIVSSLGGAEGQVKAHVLANKMWAMTKKP